MLRSNKYLRRSTVILLMPLWIILAGVSAIYAGLNAVFDDLKENFYYLRWHVWTTYEERFPHVNKDIFWLCQRKK